MKKLIKLSVIILVISLYHSCAITKIQEKQGIFDHREPMIDYNHIVIRLADSWTDSDIETFLDTMKVKKNGPNIEKCKCGDQRLMKLTWDYDQYTPLEIQGAKNSLTGGPGNAQGDWPFTFSVPLIEENDHYKLTDLAKRTKLDYRLTKYYKYGSNKQAKIDGFKESLIATPESTDISDNKVNIVVIDTGIDFYKNRDLDPFLYSTKDLDFGCNQQKSGWNFVDNTWDVSDDNGHGTYVTRLITSQLDNKWINYRILPIKVFNDKGEGNYWDIVCALSYVHEVQKENNNLDIINASFGYSFFNTQISDDELLDYKNCSIVKKLIDTLSESTTVVGSAGNINFDIDERRKENFPASFTSENIVGVGGYIRTNQATMDTDGNYGMISLDVAAPYADYKFSFEDKHNHKLEKVEVQGSSYSAAYTSAKVAEIIRSLQYVRVPPRELKDKFFEQNTPNPWTKIHDNLKPKISKGRYLDR